MGVLAGLQLLAFYGETQREERERCASFVSGGANWVGEWVGFLGTTYFTCPLLLVQSVMIDWIGFATRKRERESTHAQGLLAYIY